MTSAKHEFAYKTLALLRMTGAASPLKSKPQDGFDLFFYISISCRDPSSPLMLTVKQWVRPFSST